MLRRLASVGASLSRRRRFWLIGAAGTVFLAAATPFLWAGYHAYAAQAALNRYHSAEALRHFHICLRVWPWSRSARLHRLAARAARRQGDFKEASRLLYECRDALHDNSAEATLEWAMLHAAIGDLGTSAEELRQAARQDASLIPLVLEALAEGCLTMSRILDALHASDDWLALEPNNPQAWFVRGKIHRQAGAIQDAVADYQRVLELDPERAEARWLLILVLLNIGRYEEASGHLAIYEQLHPHDVEVQVRRAICLWRMKHEDEARALLDGVLAEHPDHGLALLTRGQIFASAERYAEAEPWLRQAAKALPHDSKAQNALWECLRQQGKTEEAEVQRERIETLLERHAQLSDLLNHQMQQRPDDPALHCQVGILYLQLGSEEVGEAWLLSALQLDEHYVPALEALAKYYQQRGNRELTEQYRQRARQDANSASGRR